MPYFADLSFKSILPSMQGLRSPSRLTLVAALPVALGTAYVLYIRHTISRQVSSTHGIRFPKSMKEGKQSTFPDNVELPSGIPQAVAEEGSEYILSFERIVSRPIPASLLAFPLPGLDGSPSELLTRYVRTTMKKFAWTPQAFILRAMVGEEAKRTFDTSAIDAMDFASPHRVAGVYCVANRSATSQGTGDQVTIYLSPPEGYHGPVVQGLIVTKAERVNSGSSESSSKEHDAVVFVNETWLWRTPDEKPTLLEVGSSRSFHTFIISRMVIAAISSVRKH